MLVLYYNNIFLLSFEIKCTMFNNLKEILECCGVSVDKFLLCFLISFSYDYVEFLCYRSISVSTLLFHCLSSHGFIIIYIFCCKFLI